MIKNIQGIQYIRVSRMSWILKCCKTHQSIEVSAVKKIIEFLRSIEQPNAHISTKGSEAAGGFLPLQSFFCMNAGIVISILSLIGMIGTSASLSEGAVYPDINAVSVYLSMLVINLLLVALLFLIFRSQNRTLQNRAI